MRLILLIPVLILMFSGSYAQDSTKTYFQSGELSSLEVKYHIENSDRLREELVQVYDIEGAEVFEGYRRNYTGHASIELKYHKNGAVRSIRYSSAPDGGSNITEHTTN